MAARRGRDGSAGGAVSNYSSRTLSLYALLWESPVLSQSRFGSIPHWDIRWCRLALSSPAGDRIQRALQMSLVDSVLGNDRIAREFGLLVTDAQALHLLALRPDIHTANQLSRATGMPTSTVTRVLDRLEAAGFLRRVPDPGDRRRINLELVMAQLEPLSARYGDQATKLQQVNEGFSNAELETVARYLEHTLDAFQHNEGTDAAGHLAESSQPQDVAKG